MNRSFRSIWNASLGAWVAVSELSRTGRGGRAASSVAIACAVVAGVIPAPAQAQYTIDGSIAGTSPRTISGTIWNVGNRLLVGTTSSGGILTIENGGIVTSVGGATLPAGYIATGANSVGTVTVTGAGSSWTLTNGELQLAWAANSAGGSATLNVLNGGSVTTSGYGARLGGTGVATVTVDGANSLLVGSTSLDVGAGSTLTASNGGTIRGGQMRISGIVNIGAAAGSAAAAPGIVSITNTGQSLSLGANALLVLNHTDTSGNYTFGVASGSAPVISGAGQIQAYNGTTVLSRNNTYTGGTVFNGGGVLQVSTNANLGGAAGGLTFNGGTLRTTAGFTMNRATTLNAGGGTFQTQTGALTQAGAITGAGALTKTGVGTLTLTGTNTYTGGTTITSGALQLGAGGTGGSIVGNVTNNGLLVFNRSDALTVSGVISGTGGVNQIGAGTTTLSGTNTYSGGTAINGGVLRVSAVTNLGSGGVTFNGGTLQTSAAFTMNRGTLLNAGGGTIDTNGFNISMGNGIGGAGTLTKTGAGTLTLTGSNTYTGGTTITSGTLQLGAGGTSGSIVGNVTNNGLLAFNRSDALTVSGVISGNGGINQIGAGTTTLTGSNTYTGSTVINNGNLTIGNGGTTGTLGTGNVLLNQPTSTLSINRSNTVLINGTLSGPGAFAQIGTGTTTLNSVNNSVGATVLSAGTLDVNGGLTTSTIAMTGASTLNVDGTVQASGSTPALLTGDAGIQTVNVAAGGVLRANGDLGDGIDSLTLLGALDTGSAALSLGSGDEILRLNDGTSIAGVGVDGGSGGSDTLIVNNALALTFDGSRTSGFETLTKQNTGTATMTGSQSFSATNLSAGTLDVDGVLTTPAIVMADTVTLNVDGTVQAAGPTQTVITGSAGVNTVTIGAVGTLLATGDLGDGIDTLDVRGALNTGVGTLSLGAGDDVFVVHDGTVVSGAVDGGTGNDARVYDINSTADLGALLNFETVTKTGGGTLNLNGPGTNLNAINVSGGELNIASGASVVANADNPLDTVVASGAILRVDGLYTGSTGSDTLTVAGTVSGGGTIALGDGDDTLTLNDGAVLNNVIDAGAHLDGNIVVLNNTSPLSVDASKIVNFDFMQKNGAGTATLTGTTYVNDTIFVNAGTLDVAGTVGAVRVNMSDNTTLNVGVGGTVEASSVFMFSNTTLNVDGTMGGSSGTDIGIASDDAASVRIKIGASGILTATAGLAGGNDVLDVFGTLIVPEGGSFGGAFSLGDGDDQLILHDGAVVTGAVHGSGGFNTDTDTVTADINSTAEVGALLDFEVVNKSGSGTLSITGDGRTIPTSSLQQVNVLGGTLNIGPGASVIANANNPLNTVVASGATLNVDGSYTGSTVSDTLTVAGAVTGTGTGTIDLSDGDDTLTLQDGANLSGLVNQVNGGTGTDTVVADIALTAILGSGAINFETLTKTNVGTLNIDASTSSAFTTVNINGGTLHIGNTGIVSDVITTTVASGATLNVDGSYMGSSGNDTMTVAGTISGSGTISLGAGEDTLTLLDGAVISGAGVNGGGGTSDTVVLNNASMLSVDVSKVSNFNFLQKDNVGTAVLTGTQSFSSGIDVNTGTLLVNGNLAGSAPTTVASGATLGGTGIIGGNVTLAGGATLAPGSNSVGTLTVNGNLALGSTSQLTFEFGQAGAVGGALNDLVNVGGDLVLDGTLDVSVPTGGSFGAGIYRMFNYAGALTDNGLAMGTMPAGSSVFVQTSVANQINLANTAGLTLNFWDGGAGIKNDGIIQAGDGSWHNGGGLNNWTEVNGLVNADYAANSFAIFQGASGVVTVDNTIGGAVGASGMQFAVDGYRVDGDPLTLSAAQSVIRVGDGTAAGAGFIATIDAELTGATKLVKTDMGTLVLGGANTYTGGTAINGGVVQIASDTNLGDAAGSLSFDSGTLRTSANLTTNRTTTLNAGGGTVDTNGFNVGMSGTVDGAGALTKMGAGTLTLTGTNNYGATTIAAGTLQVGDGGTIGTLGTGAITNNASLVFNRSDALTVANTIGGTGSLTQTGAGTTILTGTNTYTGNTDVTSGRLVVNGDQTAATGLTSVSNGATLGGSGIIGGDVTIADGTLAPGNTPTTGTLTINGNLSLTSASSLDYKLGQPNVVGGGFNDHTIVKGDLALEGTLNASTVAGGSYGVGLYRLISYDGGLTRNTLTLGTMPAGTTNYLQTSVAHQVNLINTTGVILNTWDGAAGPKNDDVINGGNGLWQSSAGNDNWADVEGDLNAPYTNNAFALFTGTPGTVTVDNSLGTVSSGGMQFATNGYVVDGAPLTLAGGAQTIIRVGDGTAVGAGYTATINAELTGATELVKTDMGTLVLSGANTYTGGTTINGGTLQVANGGTLGTGAITNNSSLVFNHSDTLMVSGAIAGAGTIRQIGSGLTNLTGNNAAFIGTTSIEAGTLAVNGSLCGTVNVQSGGRLQGTGRVCDTNNFAGGTIAPGNSIGTLTVGGNYSGNGGVLEMEAELAGTGSPADRLLITGNATGSTEIKVIHVGSSNVATGAGNTEGISLVQVGGTSTASSFALQGGYVAAGPYQYHLKFFAPGSSAAGQADPLLGTSVFGDYRLQSAVDAVGAPLTVPQISAYQALPTGALRYGASLLDTVHKRLGELRQLGVTRNKNGGEQNNEFFMRAQGSSSDIPGVQASGYDQDIWFVQAGGNVFGKDMDDGATLRIGGAISYGKSDLNTDKTHAQVNLQGTTAALTTTYQAADGWYLDGVAQFTKYSSYIKTNERGLTGSPSGSGYGLSLEGGYPIDLGDGLFLEPQAQLSFQKIEFDNFMDVDRIAVDLEDGKSLRGRLGGRLQKIYEKNTDREWSPFVEANLLHEFLDAGNISASGVKFASDSLGTSMQLGGGVNGQLGPNKIVFASVSYEKGLSSEAADAWSANVGIRIDF